jgi:hypothetical protein
MSAMESKTRATVSHRLATSLRVRCLAPAIGTRLAQDSRGAAPIANETLIVPISNKAEVLLCASA